MESRIVVSRRDLERLRPLLSARAFARTSDREYVIDLEQEIDRAAIVDDESLPAGVVALGSTVTLLDLESGKHNHYTLVLPAHANVAEGRISVLAPLGTALLGYRIGDIVPMLVVFPIGLWVFSFAADLIYSGTRDVVWAAVAYYAIAGGIIGALAAAVPGAIDLFSITRGQTRRTGVWHMVINVTALILFAINFWQRSDAREPTSGLIWLSGISVALLAVSGWLGARWSFVKVWQLRSRQSKAERALHSAYPQPIMSHDSRCRDAEMPRCRRVAIATRIYMYAQARPCAAPQCVPRPLRWSRRSS